MQLVGVTRIRGSLATHPGDGIRIQRGQIARIDGKPAPQRERPAATLLQGSVVEEGVRPAVDDLVRQHRRLGGVAADHRNASLLEMLHQLAQRVDIHHLVQAVVHRLPDQRMIGNLDRAGGVLVLAGDQRWKHRGHDVVGFESLQRRRVLAPALEAQHRQ